MAYQISVVDDEKLIVKGIKFSLEQDGMEVTAAYDGEEALQNIKEKNFESGGARCDAAEDGWA